MSDTVYQFSATTIEGQQESLGKYRGQVLLIVNTASKCGFTPQYKELQQVYETYHARGLEVLGFPCNQFGKQEPGNSEDIQSFCELRYGVTFPLFEKIDVNGKGAHPLFQHLTATARGVLGTKRIKWNFTKFLIDRAGRVVDRYGPRTKPTELAPQIEALL